jgi:hypothetical protein
MHQLVEPERLGEEIRRAFLARITIASTASFTVPYP